MTKTNKAAPTPQDFDREFRAQVAQMTAGLAPTAFTTAWADWAMHLALSPARQQALQQDALQRAQDTWTFALRALAGAPVSPSEGLAADADPRFKAQDWSQFPFNVYARAYQNNAALLKDAVRERRRRHRLPRPAAGICRAHAAGCQLAVELPGRQPRTAGPDPGRTRTEPGARLRALDRRSRAHAQGRWPRPAPRASRSARPSA